MHERIDLGIEKAHLMKGIIMSTILVHKIHCI